MPSAPRICRLLCACDEHEDPQLKALILTLRYSGLRIGDGAQLHVDRLTKDRLSYTRQEWSTGHLRSPASRCDALDGVPRVSANHWFWDGATGKLDLHCGMRITGQRSRQARESRRSLPFAPRHVRDQLAAVWHAD